MGNGHFAKNWGMVAMVQRDLKQLFLGMGTKSR